jgi:hypothetical protein
MPEVACNSTTGSDGGLMMRRSFQGYARSIHFDHVYDMYTVIYKTFSASSISLSTWNELSPLVNMFRSSLLPLPSSVCT